MEESLKRELSILRKEVAGPIEAAPQPAQVAKTSEADKKAPENGKKAKNKEDDSCCVIA